MPSAEIISIGTELLLGEIVNSNSQYLAKKLNENGIDVFFISSVGDNLERIRGVLKIAAKRSEIIITTGGLGPTIDDPTREAIASFTGNDLVFNNYLWRQIKKRFSLYRKHPTANNKKQAYIPKNATFIENPVGTAPAFFMKFKKNLIIALPGVPAEMEFLFEKNILPYLKKKYSTNSILVTRTIRTIGIGESSIDDLIGDLETSSNPTVGLAAHAAQVDIRVTAKADNHSDSMDLLNPFITQIQSKMGKYIFGMENDTLLHAINKLFKKRSIRLLVFDNTKTNYFKEIFSCLVCKFIDNENIKKQKLEITFRKLYNVHNCNAIFWLDKNNDNQIDKLLFVGEKKYKEISIFRGARSIMNEWISHKVLGLLFLKINESFNEE